MRTLSSLSRFICTASFAAFGLSASVATQAADASARFVVISHAPDADPFWNVVKNGIGDAQKDFGVTVDYRNPPDGDLADMVHLLDQAAARNYDGVATTIADLQKQYTAHLTERAKDIDAAMDAAAKKAIKDRDPTGPREKSTLMLFANSRFTLLSR